MNNIQNEVGNYIWHNIKGNLTSNCLGGAFRKIADGWNEVNENIDFSIRRNIVDNQHETFAEFYRIIKKIRK